MSGAFFWQVLRLCIISGLALPAALGAACGGDDGGDGRVNVVTSLPLFADIAANIAGERADVDSLLPEGADPHTYEPSPSDVRKVADADIVFANGLNLEPGALRIIEANLADDAVYVELAEAAIDRGLVETVESEDHEDEDGHDHAEGNPHLWLDPEAGNAYAEIIRDTLAAADPDSAAAYSANYETYAELLDGTAAYILDTVALVPEEHRLIVSTHDAFDYLARAIGFEVAGFVVPSPGQEPSPQDIADLIETIQSAGGGGIPAVFSEPQTDEEARTLEQIASEAGVEVCTLYSGAFGEDVTTYVEILRFDAEELARCLGGARD